MQEGQLGRAGELVNIGGQKLEGPLAIVEPSQIQLLPNRIPSDIPNPVPRNRLFFNGERWKYVTPQGKVLTPKGRYNFVTIDGQIYISRQTSINGGHIDIARGASVEFAGQIRFGKGKYTRGILKGWNNDSGHFKPGLDFPVEQLIPQSRLPLDRFQSFKTRL